MTSDLAVDIDTHGESHADYDPAQALTKAQRFFYDNAGFGYMPDRETEEQGRINCAVALARAESIANDRGYWFDQEREDWRECGCDLNRPHEVWCVLMRESDNSEVLISLGGICQPDNNYFRVIRAELALEYLTRRGTIKF